MNEVDENFNEKAKLSDSKKFVLILILVIYLVVVSFKELTFHPVDDFILVALCTLGFLAALRQFCAHRTASSPSCRLWMQLHKVCVIAFPALLISIALEIYLQNASTPPPNFILFFEFFSFDIGALALFIGSLIFNHFYLKSADKAGDDEENRCTPSCYRTIFSLLVVLSCISALLGNIVYVLHWSSAFSILEQIHIAYPAAAEVILVCSLLVTTRTITRSSVDHFNQEFRTAQKRVIFHMLFLVFLSLFLITTHVWVLIDVHRGSNYLVPYYRRFYPVLSFAIFFVIVSYVPVSDVAKAEPFIDRCPTKNEFSLSMTVSTSQELVSTTTRDERNSSFSYNPLADPLRAESVDDLESSIDTSISIGGVANSGRCFGYTMASHRDNQKCQKKKGRN